MLQTLINVASERYRAAGRYAYHFARGKLAGDPIFEAILAHGLLASRVRILLLSRGHGLQRLNCRSTSDWLGLLSLAGFDSEFLPMSAGTPFANVLIIARPR